MGIQAIFQKLGKKPFLYIVIIIVILAIILIWYFGRISEITEEEKPKPAEKTYQEVIQDLTAPAEVKPEPLSEEVIQELTAPKKGKPMPLSEEIIKNLTAPKQ